MEELLMDLGRKCSYKLRGKNVEVRRLRRTGEELKDKPWLQDGVAPQCGIIGLDIKNRVFIPSDEKQGFLESHLIGNYGWIFNLKEKGHVKQRE